MSEEEEEEEGGGEGVIEECKERRRQLKRIMRGSQVMMERGTVSRDGRG